MHIINIFHILLNCGFNKENIEKIKCIINNKYKPLLIEPIKCEIDKIKIKVFGKNYIWN
jgi:hypothetical protein